MLSSIAILAGGQSQRMGQNKALMSFNGRPLIARIVERLAALGIDLFVVANEPQDFEFLGIPLHTDLLPGRGKLGGLHTALSVAQTPAVGVVACDMPFVTPALLQYEFDLLAKKQVDVVVPRSRLGLEPQHSVYRRLACLPVVKAALDAGREQVIAWYPEVKTYQVPQSEMAPFDPQGVAFINVNTLQEFQQAEALAKTQKKEIFP